MEYLEDYGEGRDGYCRGRRQLQAERLRRNQQHARFENPARSGPQRRGGGLARRHLPQSDPQRVDPGAHRLRWLQGQTTRSHDDQSRRGADNHDRRQGEGGQSQLVARGDREEGAEQQYYRGQACQVEETRDRGRRGGFSEGNAALSGKVWPYGFPGLEGQQMVCQQRGVEHGK